MKVKIRTDWTDEQLFKKVAIVDLSRNWFKNNRETVFEILADEMLYFNTAHDHESILVFKLAYCSPYTSDGFNPAWVFIPVEILEEVIETQES